jgi:site-specific recombinase XerD
MDHYFRYDSTRQQLRVGPLSNYLDIFAQHLFKHGYAIHTGRRKLWSLSRLSLWMDRRGLQANDLNEQVLKRFIADRRRQGRLRRTDREAVESFLEYLRQTGVLEPSLPRCVDDIYRPLERDFERYLLHERGLALATIGNYLWVSRLFLTTHFNKEMVDPQSLRPSDVIRFVQRIAQSQPRSSAKFTITGLRAFLRFLYVQGRTATNLTSSVPTIPYWKVTVLPKTLKVHEIESLLRSCDQTTAVGKRDYAVLSMLARLGLRAGEVVGMTLDDIDWRAGELTVRGKGRTRERLPLLAEVGQALAAYLREARPSCASRHLFVTTRAPFHELAGPTSVGNIVRRALQRAGLNPPQRGAHLLRHSLATTLLQRGASLQEIGDVLRHRYPATTQIYAKVDIAALQTLVQPWPEEVS